MPTLKSIRGFTLVELLIVIAILAILAAGVMVAINPGKRTAQARDAQRKADINAIANALVAYYTLNEKYPTEKKCDTSRGYTVDPENGINSLDCSQLSGPDWIDYSQSIFDQLVNRGDLKKLPKDPINNSVFYFRYEPSAKYVSGANDERYCSFVPCDRYWIGVRLESVDNTSKKNKIVFRCSDDTSLAAGAGCKEVEFQDPTGILSFDFSLRTE